MKTAILVLNTVWMIELLIGAGIVCVAWRRYKINVFGWLSLYFIVSFSYRIYWQIWHLLKQPAWMADFWLVPVGLFLVVSVLGLTLWKFVRLATGKEKVK